MDEKTKLKFLSIKEHRPTHGAHIFVWDNVEKKAHPCLYLGTQEIWEASKDKEVRFTHFVELDLPQQASPK